MWDISEKTVDKNYLKEDNKLEMTQFLALVSSLGRSSSRLAI